MQRFIIVLLCLFPAILNAQLSIGVKAGLNFANVTNASGIKAESRTGYMIGGYIAPKAKKVLGFRSEIILSRQGYDYKTSTNTGNVNLARSFASAAATRASINLRSKTIAAAR